MFDYNEYPHTDFNKINLDWILSGLPIDITDKITIPVIETVTEFFAIKIGPLVHIHALIYPTQQLPDSTVVLVLPFNAKGNQIFGGLRYGMENDIGGYSTLFRVEDGHEQIKITRSLLSSQAVLMDITILVEDE